MHELSIAQSVLDTVLQEMAARGLDRVDSVTVRVGALSGVLPGALQFSFEAIRRGTPLEPCELKIERVPMEIGCRECGSRTTVDEFLFICPVCDSAQIDVVAGYELEVTCLEVPDTVDNLSDP